MTAYIDDIFARVLGCDWGHSLGLPGDREPCTRTGTTRMALHGQQAIFTVQVCDVHRAIIEHHTSDHAQPEGVPSDVL